MIRLDDVGMRYRGHGGSHRVLDGVSLTIPAGLGVGVIGAPASGRSTLIRLLAGIDQPTHGRIEHDCRVSWPIGKATGLNLQLSGRVNAKFLCRLEGRDPDHAARLAWIHEFSELGRRFEQPVGSYTPALRAQLQFALSLAFEFDVYLSDEVTAIGEGAFREKSAAAFRQLAARSGLVLVHDRPRVLREFCSAGIWLHDGRADWFDDIDAALSAHQQSGKLSP
ncbi:ABC transporter ATP-binding protein [Derxia lacustris]|uniref:ABC transporter ATP-binding protein n=1 Tax=Derxia lacustris TaxID=764842 RepID=UPI000A16CC09|nr:ATP-binding cassette domain-containing protein [Derxia lacustris]